MAIHRGMHEDSHQSAHQHAGTAASIAKNTILLIKGNCPEMFLSGAVNGSISKKKVLHNCVNHSTQNTETHTYSIKGTKHAMKGEFFLSHQNF